MDTQCNTKTVRGSLTIIFCIFMQIGYHTSRALKSVILRQLNSRTHDALARCPVKTPVSYTHLTLPTKRIV